MTNNWENLGEITQEQREEIWATKVSGSQVKSIMAKPNDWLAEKFGDKPKLNLRYNDDMIMRLDAGNFFEQPIIDRAKALYPELGGIKTDKSTFQSTNYKFRTCNIDGYIGKDLDNIEALVEVKNTASAESLNELYKTYEWQLRYYMWFFNVDKVILIGQFNGWNTRYTEVLRCDARELEMLQMLEAIDLALEHEGYLEIEEEEVCVVDELEFDEDTFQEVANKIMEVAEIKKQATKDEKELKQQLLDMVPHKESKDYDYEDIKIKRTFIEEGITTDWKKIAQALIDKYKENEIELCKAYSKKKASQNRWSFKTKEKE